MKKKIILFFLIIFCLALFFSLGGPSYLSFEYFSEQRERLQQLYRENPILFIAGYFFVYLATTALSLPGALVLTIFAGGIFGLWVGFFLVSFASSLGATLAFLSSRFLFREAVEKKFHAVLKDFLRKFESDGIVYLLFLRLVPAFPFFLVNLVCGLSRVPTFTFYWVSQLGMLPATLLYVNAGKEIGTLKNPSDIFSPSLLISFVLLGVFPLFIKKAWSVFYGKRG